MVYECVSMDFLSKVTIAIPVYNVEKYVEKSLRSALDQKFDAPFEVLIIDDRGNDRSMEIVHDIVESHPRGSIVRVVTHETNKGLGPARNTAIENAKGEYLFFLDSDDWISDDCLSLLYRKALETGAEMVVGSVSRVEDLSGKVVSENRYAECFYEHDAAGVYFYAEDVRMHIEVWNKLFRMDFLRKYQIGCVHRIMEDYIFDFNMRCNIRKIAMIPNVTLFYNVRENSIVTKLRGRRGSDESAYTFSNIIERLQNLVKDKYSEIPGVYDLYFCRAIWALEGIESSVYDEKQMDFIRTHIKGYRDFVPSLSKLRNPRNRFVYRFDDESKGMDHFYKVNNFSKSLPARIFFKLVKKIR